MKRFHSWWQKIRHRRVAIGVVAIVFVVVIAIIIAGYWFDWTGFNGYNKVTIVHTISGTNAGTVTRTEEYQPGKTLWDWLQLLFVPVVIAIGGFWLNQLQKSREERHTERLEVDKQREASLQAYLANMKELLLEKQLLESSPDTEIRITARVLTLTVLPKLDPLRKRTVMRFLHDSHLIYKDKTIIYLYGADLSGADLQWSYQPKANLREAQLQEANMRGANLREADLRKANLSGANLSGANLSGANLSGANLSGAIGTTSEQLGKAKLNGATMPDGSILP